MGFQEKNNYFKLVALIVDIACHVIFKYISEKIIGPDSFETFLNKEKHKLLHVYEALQCCACTSGRIIGERLISRKQLLKLYKSDEKNKNNDHQKYARGKLAQRCICCYSAIANVDIKVVDITLASLIIKKTGKSEPKIELRMEQIKYMRDELFHLSDVQEMTDKKFREQWTKLEYAIIGIAKLISSAYAEETMKKILQTKKLTTVIDAMSKNEKLCRDYWKNKCAEFERAHFKEMEKKAAALQFNMPEIFNRSRESDCNRILTKIKTFETMVDQINIITNIFCNEDNKELFDVTEEEVENMQRIHMPVLLQLDIPNSWDKTKAFDVIDEMRLKGTPDMNIRIKSISTDDFNIFAEIANKLLYNVKEMQPQIKQMLSNILSEAAIVTSKPDQVCVAIKVLENANSQLFESYFKFDVKLRLKFRLPLIISDCLINKDKLVFSKQDEDFDNRLLIYNIDGSFNRGISVSSEPRHISVINDNDVAVSSMTRIQIININTEQLIKVIQTDGVPHGISYQNGLIYTIIDEEKIDVIDLTGKIIRSFPCPSESRVQFISTDSDRLYLTDSTYNCVYCVDLNGSEIWKCTDDKMILPWGVSSDQDGYVYVICHKSNNVIVVSPDGKHHKELLTEKDGLQNPTGIYYDKPNNCLLVCSVDNCEAFLFDIKH